MKASGSETAAIVAICCRRQRDPVPLQATRRNCGKFERVQKTRSGGSVGRARDALPAHRRGREDQNPRR